MEFSGNQLMVHSGRIILNATDNELLMLSNKVAYTWAPTIIHESKEHKIVADDVSIGAKKNIEIKSKKLISIQSDDGVKIDGVEIVQTTLNMWKALQAALAANPITSPAASVIAPFIQELELRYATRKK
jgi:hypothetical protein